MGWKTKTIVDNQRPYRGLILFVSTVSIVAISTLTVIAWLANDLTTLLLTLLTALSLTVYALLTNRPDNTTIALTKPELDNTTNHASFQHDSLLAVINNLKNAIVGVGNDRRVSLYNASTLNLLDTNQELENQPIEEVLKLEDSRGNPISLLNMLAKVKTVKTRDDVYITQGDEQLRLELTISPIRSSYTKLTKGSTISGHILIIRDITKAKSLEEEKDEFISVVSHELRTPIAVAEGTISNVLAMIDKRAITPEKAKEAIETAHNQVVFLSKMINDLSTLSRAERGLGGEVTRINVSQLIRDMYNEYKNSAEKKHLHLNLDMPTNVGAIMTSELYLKELLQNLISNALKYTEEGSVTISAKQIGQTITLSIKDTGIGISKTDQSKVMERFFRSEDYRTRETGGTGLGLYVADKLARKIGTRINLKSRLNHGSTFWIELIATEKDTKD